MDWLSRAYDFQGSPILYVDMIAMAWYIFCWFGYAYYADNHYGKKINLVKIMDDMRTRWMHQMIKRDARMSDATLIGNIARSISFFASTTVLILIGIVTVMGSNQKEGMQVVSSLPFVMGSTAFMWELKLALLALIFTYAFFKLTWSLRQYNYVSIVVGAAPLCNEHKSHHYEYARRAGKLIGNAGRHFNFGLRAYYFGLAVISWFLNGYVFIGVTTLIVWVAYRREFRSHTVNNLLALDEA
jgi:uncharacterized membrane protein